MATTIVTTNIEKLTELVADVFLIDPSEFRLDLTRDEIETWDSLGIVSLAVGVQEVFGYHLTQDEATSLSSIRDLVSILESRGIGFDV